MARAEVPLEAHDGRGRPQAREIPQVLRVGATETVDGLGVVAHDGQPPTVGAQGSDDVDLDAVEVLVLVHEHMVESRREELVQLVVAEQAAPKEEQVVEVHERRRPLALGEGAEQCGDGVSVWLTPREVHGDHVAEWALGVDAP